MSCQCLCVCSLPLHFCVCPFLPVVVSEGSTLKIQNTCLLRNITAEHHKPTHHHRWLLLVAGIPVGADWLEPLERARAFLKGLRILVVTPVCIPGLSRWSWIVWLGGGFVVGAMCSGVPACSLSFSVCVVCVSLLCCCRVVVVCATCCVLLGGVLLCV